jgi:hypothetical protein
MYPQLRGLAEGPATLWVLASVPPTVRRLAAPAGSRVSDEKKTVNTRLTYRRDGLSGEEERDDWEI